MNTATKISFAAVTVLIFACPVLLCADTVPAQDAKADTVPAKGAKPATEETTPLTKEQLNTKVPHFYCFNYDAEPQRGKRFWLRVSD